MISLWIAVREDVPDGTVIATVHATDLDSGVKKHGGSVESPSAIVSNYLAYFIVEGNEKGHFNFQGKDFIF
jgi:hypothetical protein